jgi:hypothetical protein
MSHIYARCTHMAHVYTHTRTHEGTICTHLRICMHIFYTWAMQLLRAMEGREGKDGAQYVAECSKIRAVINDEVSHTAVLPK